MHLTFVSSNPGKYASFRAVFPPEIDIVLQDTSFAEPEGDVRDIATTKAAYALETGVKQPYFVLDCGLDGARHPGSSVSRIWKKMGPEAFAQKYAGPCAFQQCVVFVDTTGRFYHFEAEMSGRMVAEPKGPLGEHHNWSLLWPYFLPDRWGGRSLAEVSQEEYVAWRKGNEKRSLETAFPEWFLRDYPKIPSVPEESDLFPLYLTPASSARQ